MQALAFAGVCLSYNATCMAHTSGLTMADMARVTLDSLYSHYAVEGTFLLREHHPFDSSFKADYLAGDDGQKGNPYSYLWPFSGTLSAAKALYEATGDPAYLQHIDHVVLPGLQCYSDTLRSPHAYSSYILGAKQSDRFYDDNEWIGIDLAELYLHTGIESYLDTARKIWEFIESGTDARLGGGVYWCEQKKGSKNTCANAPAAVMAIRLFQATGDSLYLQSARDIYKWTRDNLRDSTDGLYFDHKTLKGRIGPTKYAYNSGQMLEAASLLYEVTGTPAYRDDADEIAEAATRLFIDGPAVTDTDGEFKLMSPGSIWFTAIMMRGFDEYGRITGNNSTMDTYVRNLRYAWDSMREPQTGLFNEDWTGSAKKDKKWLLTQAAMVEMYANAAKYENRGKD